MKNSLKNTLCQILQKLGVISDWVVEQGTSGIWTYRKWNSGIAECWGTFSITSVTKGAWGSMYSYQGNSSNYPNYPSGLFIATPDCNVSCKSMGGANFWICTCGEKNYASKDRPMGVQFVRPSDYMIMPIDLSYHAIGKWK